MTESSEERSRVGQADTDGFSACRTVPWSSASIQAQTAAWQWKAAPHYFCTDNGAFYAQQQGLKRAAAQMPCAHGIGSSIWAYHKEVWLNVIKEGSVMKVVVKLIQSFFYLISPAISSLVQRYQFFILFLFWTKTFYFFLNVLALGAVTFPILPLFSHLRRRRSRCIFPKYILPANALWFFIFT